MKYAFFGTDQFSVAILEKLISDFYHPSYIVTMPDRPVGRKQELQAPPIKEVCLSHSIPYSQPEDLRDIIDKLKSLDLDTIIVASYGKIISKEILDIPKQGAINVHTSLLPKYRGPSPIQSAILEGEDHTGITIMHMDEKMDHGDIIYQKKVDIDPRETYRSLHSKLAHTGADVLTKVLPDLLKGNLKPHEQDHDQATYSKMISKENGRIHWNQKTVVIDRQIRALFDWPMAWTLLPDGKRIKIISAIGSIESDHQKPGILTFTDGNVTIGTEDGYITLVDMQVEGKKAMNARDFQAGYHRFNGEACQS